MERHSRGRTSTLVLATVLAAGCVTGIQLTDKGESVRRLEATEMPAGCHLVGDVAIGIPPDAAHAATEEELMLLMRNQAGQNGANVVVVDWTEKRDGTSEEGRHWVGRGRSYNCPEPEEESAGGEAALEEEDPAEEGAAEEGSDDEGSDDEGADDDEAAGGVSDEDLLDI